MDSKVICDETTPYTILLYRKDRELRLWEIGGFLIGLILLLSFLEFRSTPFIVALFLLAAAVMAGMPVLYRVIYFPRYILYEDRLEIRKGRRRKAVSLNRLKPAYDLPYFYLIDGKRTPLLVSDDFLKHLDERMEILRQEGGK